MLKNIKLLTQSQLFLRYFKNSSWMMAEFVLRVVSAIFVTIYVARYLGPESFGVLSYALAIVTIFMAISRLGMDNILVRDLARHKEKASEYMGTAFSLMLVASLGAFISLFFLIYFYETDTSLKGYILIISFSLFTQPLLVSDYGFQAQVKAKYSAISKSFGLLISSIIKIYLVRVEADLYFIAVAFMLDYVLIAIFLFVVHTIKKQPYFLLRFKSNLVKPLLKSAWPMILSTISIILYMRIDQIMIKNMLDNHHLGLYAAATRIYEGWVMVSVVIAVSLLPAIVKLKSSSPENYESSLTKLFALMFWMNLVAAAVSAMFSEFIIHTFLGAEFASVSNVFIIIMWSTTFTAIGSLTLRYLTVEGMEKKIAFRTFIALVVNVTLNWILIPIYGLEGAAVATLVTIVISNYFINYFDKDLKQLTKICNNAILLKLTSIK